MEELISFFIKKLSNYFLGDVEILKDLNLVLQWTTLQEIKTSIMNYRKLINDDIIHLYYSRYLQTLFTEKALIPEVCMYGVTLLVDLKNCNRDLNIENSIKLLIRQIGSSIKESKTLESISMLVNEVKRMNTEFDDDSFIDIENDIYLGLKSWIVEKKQDFDIWKLRECYNKIDRILTNNTIKQEINDLVAVKAYNWFQKTYSSLIQFNACKNILNALNEDTRKIYNWITSIDSRSDIYRKINNFEPLIEKPDSYARDPKNSDLITDKNQLIKLCSSNGYIDYISSAKKNSYHLAVYKAIIQETGETVAVKSFMADNPENLQNAHNEIKIYEKLLKIEKDFMLKYYGSYKSEKTKNKETKYKLSLVLEYCDCTLNDEIITLYRDKRAYTNLEIAQKVYTLLDLWKQLRDAKVNHCDIKPENIFIVSEKRFKLGDFDLSETFNTNQASDLGTTLYGFHGGTVNFMSPEVKELYAEWKKNENSIDKKMFSRERSDVYSLGIVFLIMMMAPLRLIGDLNDPSQMIEELKMDWQKRLLRKMLANNYRNRPRFREALDMLEEDPEFILCLNSSG